MGDERAPLLLAAKGYERARSFFRMVTDVTAPIPEPVWPRGVELRPLDPDRDGRPLFDAELDFSVSENPTWRFNFVPHARGELRAEVTDSKDGQYVGTLAVG